MSGSQTYLNDSSGGGGSGSSDSATEYLRDHFQDSYRAASSNSGLISNATINPYGDFFANNSLPMPSHKFLEFKYLDLLQESEWINRRPTYKVRFSEDYPHVAVYVWGQAYINNWYNAQTIKWYQAISNDIGNGDNGFLVVGRGQNAWLWSNGPQVYPYSSVAPNAAGFNYSTSLDGVNDISASPLINYDHYYKSAWGKKAYFLPMSTTTASFNLHAWRAAFSGDEINFNGILVEHFQQTDQVYWNAGEFFLDKELKETSSGTTYSISHTSPLGGLRSAQYDELGTREIAQYNLPYLQTVGQGLSGQALISVLPGQGQSFANTDFIMLDAGGGSASIHGINAIAGDIFSVFPSLPYGFSGNIFKAWSAGATLSPTDRAIYTKQGEWSVNSEATYQGRSYEDRISFKSSATGSDAIAANFTDIFDFYSVKSMAKNYISQKREDSFRVFVSGGVSSSGTIFIKNNVGGHLLSLQTNRIVVAGKFNSIDVELWPKDQIGQGGNSTYGSTVPDSSTDYAAQVSGASCAFTVLVNGVSSYTKIVSSLTAPMLINLAKDLPYQLNTIEIFSGANSSSYIINANLGLGTFSYYTYTGVTNSLNGVAGYAKSSSIFQLSNFYDFGVRDRILPMEMYSSTLNLGGTNMIVVGTTFWGHQLAQIQNDQFSFGFYGSAFKVLSNGGSFLAVIGGVTQNLLPNQIVGLSNSVHTVQVYTRSSSLFVLGVDVYGPNLYDTTNFQAGYLNNKVRYTRHFEGIYPPTGAGEGDTWTQSHAYQKTYKRLNGTWQKVVLGAPVDAIDTDFTYRQSSLGFSAAYGFTRNSTSYMPADGDPTDPIWAAFHQRSRWQKKSPQQFFSFEVNAPAVNNFVPNSTQSMFFAGASGYYGTIFSQANFGRGLYEFVAPEGTNGVSLALGGFQILTFKRVCYVNAVAQFNSASYVVAGIYTNRENLSNTDQVYMGHAAGISNFVSVYNDVFMPGDYLGILKNVTISFPTRLKITGFILD